MYVLLNIYLLKENSVTCKNTLVYAGTGGENTSMALSLVLDKQTWIISFGENHVMVTSE